MKTRFLATLAMLLIGQMVLAQDFDQTKLDSYFDALETNNKFMGSVAVSRNGEIIYARSVGFLDAENHLKANESTKYRIGSISKTFTTVLVFKAIEEKKLSLDQTIDHFFPSIPNGAKITIRHLLNHRSGIHSFTDDKEYLSWNTQAKTGQEMLDIIVKGGSDFEPDSKAAYSNSNFVLLTFIVEKTFKKTYAELLKNYITGPLGLRNTALGKKIETQNNEAKSYRFAGNWIAEPETDISVPLGAGGIVSTPSDLVRFSDALFGGKLLKPESVESMKAIKDHYGLGLFVIPFYEVTGYGHTGGIDGFSSVFSHFSTGNISYAMISNGSNFNNNNISIAVLSAVYNKPYDIPVFSAYQIDPNDLDHYLGVYASPQLPLKITITKANNALIAQGSGQSPFPLEATEKDKFKFDQAGVVMEFNPAEKTMVLKQGGGQFNFTKE